MALADRDFKRLGQVRFFQDVRKVADSIRDDLLQWLQPPNTRGDLFPVVDRLSAPDTWINTTYLGWNLEPVAGLKVYNKFKWQFHHQNMERRLLALQGLRDQGSFLGLVNKAEYRLNLGKLSLNPAWKSEFVRRTPTYAPDPQAKEWSQLYMALVRMPVLRRSSIEGGVEYEVFKQLRDPTPPGSENSFNGLVVALQLTNVSEYLGYRLTTLAGLQVTRRRFEIKQTQTDTRGFLTVYAGVQ